jgi:hypothetical protein
VIGEELERVEVGIESRSDKGIGNESERVEVEIEIGKDIGIESVL